MKHKIICFIILLIFLVVFQPSSKTKYVRSETITDVVEEYAFKYDVSAKEILRTMRCESSLNPNEIYSTKREYSVGLSQINLKAHPDITVKQAKDIRFATEYMAKHFAKGHKKMWTCAVKLGFVS